MGFADRLASKVLSKAEQAVTKAAVSAKDAIDARSDGAGPRLLALLRMDNDRPITVEALIVLLVDAVRKDDESRELSDKDVYRAAKRRYRRLGTVSLPSGPVGGYLVNLYCEAATLCDIVELRGEPMTNEEVASHLLVIWRAMPDTASADTMANSTPSIAETNADQALPSHLAMLLATAPPAVPNSPAAYKSPPNTASARTLDELLLSLGPIPEPRADQLLPFHLAMPLANTSPTIEKLPPM